MSGQTGAPRDSPGAPRHHHHSLYRSCLPTDIWTGVPAGVPCLTSLVTGVLTRGDRQVQTGGLTGGRSRVCSSSRPSVPPGLAQSYCQPLRHVGTAPPVATVQYITVLYCTVQSVAAGFQPSVGLGGRAPHVSETVSGCLLPGSSQQTLRTKYRHKVTTCSETERYPAECCGGEIPRQTSLCPPCQISGQGSAPSVPGEIQREKDFFQSHPAS